MGPMKNLGVLFLVGVGFSSFLGCATRPVQFDSQGVEPLSQWEGKAEVLDKQKSKSNSLSVDFVAEKRSRLRMDVTGSFSTPVAAAVVSQGKMTYILPQQKKFYQGTADKKSLDRLLKVDIGVDDLFAILYDEPLTGWSCQKNSLGQVDSCAHKSGQISLESTQRDGYKRTVKIISPNFEIKMNLARVAPKAKDLEKVFSLKIPESFKAENYAPKQL